MILSMRPKMGSIMAASSSKKPAFVQEMGPLGPPEMDMEACKKEGAEMAAQRLIDAVRSGDAKAVVEALNNLDSLRDCSAEG